MQLLGDPGFEDGTDWVYSGGCERQYGVGARHTGSYGAFIGYRAGHFGTPTMSQIDLPLTPGNRCLVRVWCKSEGIYHAELTVQVDAGDGVYVEHGARSTTVDDWVMWNLGGFTALGTTGRIRIRCSNLSHNDHGWHVDDVLLVDTEVDVAVKLAERAIDAVVTLLQANLATELTAIDTERADSVTTAAPANAQYYKRPKAEIAGATVHVEVYESSFDFVNPYTDADAQRAVYEIPLTVRVTCFNRNGVDPANAMMKRMRRYATGVFNVINKNYTLDDSDDATQVGTVEGVDPHWEFEGEDADKVRKVQAVVRVNVRCEETQ